MSRIPGIILRTRNALPPSLSRRAASPCQKASRSRSSRQPMRKSTLSSSHSIRTQTFSSPLHLDSDSQVSLPWKNRLGCAQKNAKTSAECKKRATHTMPRTRLRKRRLKSHSVLRRWPRTQPVAMCHRTSQRQLSWPCARRRTTSRRCKQHPWYKHSVNGPRPSVSCYRLVVRCSYPDFRPRTSNATYWRLNRSRVSVENLTGS